MKKLILTVWFVLISGLVLNIHSQTLWQLKNPLVPDSDKVNVCFIDESTGWILSEDEEILFTDDGGLQWETRYKFASTYLDDIFFIDDNLGYAYGKHVFKTLNGGLTWEKVFHCSYYDKVLSLFFSSENVGWIGTYFGNILKTENGGISWELIDTPFEGKKSSKIFFINENEGWIIYKYGAFIRTSDGGQTWQTLQEDNSMFSYKDVWFTNSNVGWILYWNHYLLKTEDGGSTLDTIFIDGESSLMGLKLFDENIGVCYSASDLYRTNNGGESWTEYPFPDYHYINSASFPTLEYVCAVNGEIEISTDGGSSWTVPELGFIEDLNSVFYTTNDKLFVVGDEGAIRRSEDKGDSWIDFSLGINEELFDIFFTNETNGWICGEDGILYYTNDGGITWELKNIGASNNLFSLYFVNDQIGFVAGNFGQAFKTINGGEEWIELETNSGTLYDMFFLDENTGWFSTGGGHILKTTDGGNTFESYQTLEESRLRGIYFKDEMTGWVVGRRYVNYTEDGGETWSIQFSGPYNNSFAFNDIWFSGPDNGWVCAEDGFILHTMDGGENWVEQKGFDFDLYSLCITPQEEVYTVGRYGCVMFNKQASFLAPGILSQSTDTTICEGDEFNLVVNAVGDSISFQWYNASISVFNAQDDTLHFSSISPFEGGYYYCEISNKAGIINSDNIMLSVKPKVSITGNPMDTSIFVNESINLVVGAVGALPLSYQWQKAGMDIPGAIQNAYALYGAQLSDSGNYRCIVSNDCSVDTSEVAKITVLPESNVSDLNDREFLRVYPNPVSQELRVYFEYFVKNGSYYIYNSMGESVLSGHANNTDFLEVNISDLKRGVYVLNLMESGNSFSVKFVKD